MELTGSASSAAGLQLWTANRDDCRSLASLSVPGSATSTVFACVASNTASSIRASAAASLATLSALRAALYFLVSSASLAPCACVSCSSAWERASACSARCSSPGSNLSTTCTLGSLASSCCRAASSCCLAWWYFSASALSAAACASASAAAAASATATCCSACAWLPAPTRAHTPQ